MVAEVRTRRAKQPEARAEVERIMQHVRVIESPEERDVYDELLDYIQDNWEEASSCDLDEYDVARAVRKLHSSGTLLVWHRHPVTEEKHHRVQIASAPRP
jgi:hypothetical protein